MLCFYFWCSSCCSTWPFAEWHWVYWATASYYWRPDPSWFRWKCFFFWFYLCKYRISHLICSLSWEVDCFVSCRFCKFPRRHDSISTLAFEAGILANVVLLIFGFSVESFSSNADALFRCRWWLSSRTQHKEDSDRWPHRSHAVDVVNGRLCFSSWQCAHGIRCTFECHVRDCIYPLHEDQARADFHPWIEYFDQKKSNSWTSN